MSKPTTIIVLVLGLLLVGGTVYIWHQLNELSELKEKTELNKLIHQRDDKYNKASNKVKTRVIEFERNKDKIVQEVHDQVINKQKEVGNEEEYTIVGSDVNVSGVE